MRTRSQGFTLIEMLIVVAVLAILASVAFPAYQEQMQSTRRAEGIALLSEVMQAQEREYVDQRTYRDDLTDLGYASATLFSDNGYYEVGAAACGAGLTVCVQITATGQGPQAGFDMSLNTLGTRTGF